MECDIIRKGDRTFGYKLDEKTAKSKLLKGTKKVPFEVTEKQNCSNIDFNPGAFKSTVEPLINLWENCSKNGELFEIGDRKLSVNEFKKGFDENNKHIDTKVVLFDKTPYLGFHNCTKFYIVIF